MNPKAKACSRVAVGRVSAGLAALAVALCALPSISEVRPTPEQPVTVADRLAEARKLARTDPASAGASLRAMDTASMEPQDRDAWHDIARSVALRTGDRDWLVSLREHRSEFSEVDVYRVLLAGGMLEEGRVDDARAELAKIGDIEAVNVRDRRRVYALEARIAWLDGDVSAERAAVEKIVHELQYWDTPSCQRCHSDASHPGEAPLLDARSAWYAERLVALMEQQGDASGVRERAEAALAADSEDVEARLRLAYASVALGLDAEANEHFAMIPWMRLPGRTGGSPRMMMPYP